jgi:hypothetical protein
VPNYIDSKNGPELFVFVEWVRSSAVEEISRIAGTVGLHYFVGDVDVTVYGYR